MEKVVKWSTLWVVDPPFAGSSPVLLPNCNMKDKGENDDHRFRKKNV